MTSETNQYIHLSPQGSHRPIVSSVAHLGSNTTRSKRDRSTEQWYTHLAKTSFDQILDLTGEFLFEFNLFYGILNIPSICHL